ncbi:MAG: recombinase family protein [Candidatus Xenobiia bacterium LiM19]
MPFCAIYTRVSSELQDVDTSLSAQESELRARAEKDGFTVYEVFSDPAESGRLSDRPAFQRLITLSKQSPPPFQRLYLWDIRRFGRNRTESSVFKQRLRSRGIEIIYLKENVDDSGTGRLIEAIIEAIAEYESCNIAEDTRRGHREITRRGYIHGGAPPFGYRHKVILEGTKERKGLEPDPEKAPWVRWMYEQKEKGESPGAIARGLTLKGIMTTRKKIWNSWSVEMLLRNPIYVGRLEYGRQSAVIVDGKKRRVDHDPEKWTICENACEAIVGQELWERVQDIMGVRKRGQNQQKNRKVYLLSGILACSRCGGPLVGLAKKRNTQHTRYYYCRTQKATGACTGAIVRADDLEKKVLEVMKKKLSAINIDDLVEERYITRTGEKERYEAEKKSREAELKKVQKSIDNITAAIEEGFRTTELLERMSELGKRKDALIKDMTEAEKDANIDEALEKESLRLLLSDISQTINMASEYNPEDLRDMLKTMIRVEFDAEKKTGQILFSPPISDNIAVSCDGFLNTNRSGQI